MTCFNCNFKYSCTAAAVIASIIIGIITTFLQVTAVITVGTAFLWVAFGIAIGYLAVLIIATALERGAEEARCKSSALGTVLAGILGTAFFSVLLLAIGITATSVFSAILVGLLLTFLALIVTGSACLVKCLAGVGE